MNEVIKAIQELNETMQSIRQEISILSLAEHRRPTQRSYYEYEALSKYFHKRVTEMTLELKYSREPLSEDAIKSKQNRIDECQKSADSIDEKMKLLVEDYDWIIVL